MGKTAAAFSTGTAYTAGDLVLYGGALYVFTASHSAGAWTGSDAAPVDGSIQQDLTRILAGAENAAKAAAYADTIVFSPSLIAGTRYKYTLTSAADPRQ